MAEIAAFRGILYDNAQAGPADKLLAPPYDVISPSERDKLASLDRAQLRAAHPARGRRRREVRARGADLDAWLAEGVMRRDSKPALYRYHQTFTAEGKTTTGKGFICRIRLARFDEGVVLPHERTLGGAEGRSAQADARHPRHLSQVFGLYSDRERARPTSRSRQVEPRRRRSRAPRSTA